MTVALLLPLGVKSQNHLGCKGALETSQSNAPGQAGPKTPLQPASPNSSSPNEVIV